MTAEQSRQEIRNLVIRIEQTRDPRKAVEIIRKRIAELNNCGETVPEEFIWIQNRYVDECIYREQDR